MENKMAENKTDWAAVGKGMMAKVNGSEKAKDLMDKAGVMGQAVMGNMPDSEEMKTKAIKGAGKAMVKAEELKGAFSGVMEQVQKEAQTQKKAAQKGKGLWGKLTGK